MKKIIRLASIICLLCVVLYSVGCNATAENYDLNENKGSNEPVVTKGKVVGGILVMPQTPSGLALSADKGTFSNNTQITVSEKNFDEDGNYLLIHSDKMYSINGVVESNNEFEQKRYIKNLERPMLVSLPNTMQNIDVNAYYVGMRESGETEWKFSRINEDNSTKTPLGISSVRVSKGAVFYLKLSRLNVEFALFADPVEDSKLNDATVVEAVSTKIKSADPNTENEDKIKVEKGFYTEDIKVEMDLKGRNVESIPLLDYVLELSYVNGKSEKNKSIAGPGAQYKEEPVQNSGSSDGFVHTLIVKDFKIENGKIVFDLKTNGIAVEDFPLDFSIELKGSDNNRSLLPFEYGNMVKVEVDDITEAKEEEKKRAEEEQKKQEEEKKKQEEEEKKKEEDEPVIQLAKPELVGPKHVIIACDRVRFGESVSLAWEPGDKTAEGIVYDIYLRSADSTETIVAKDLTENVWNSDAGENALAVGSYSVMVCARDTEGQTASSSYVPFEVLLNGLPTPVISGLNSQYRLGEKVEISWSEIKDALGNQVIYSIWLWNSELGDRPVNPTKTGSLNSFSVEGLATGSYRILVGVQDETGRLECGSISSFDVFEKTIISIRSFGGSICADGSYILNPSFEIVLSENNCLLSDLQSAISVEGVQSGDLILTPLSSGFVLSFRDTLERNQSYTIKMSSINDKYGLQAEKFNDFIFRTIPFAGKGTDLEPFIISSALTAEKFCNNGKFPLVGTFTVDVNEILIYLDTFAIDGKSIIKNNGENWVESSNFTMADGAIFVGLEDDGFWDADSELKLSLFFKGTYDGNTYYFQTAEYSFSLEDGKYLLLGQGTIEDPYLVYTKFQLDKIREHLNSHYKQIRDIDLEGYNSYAATAGQGWEPIGGYVNDELILFTGIYDGCNRTISNLRMVSAAMTTGLFGAVKGYSTTAGIKNLKLTDCYIENSSVEPSSYSDKACQGMLVGYVGGNSEYSGCYASGTVKAEWGFVGGLLGTISPTEGRVPVKDCECDVVLTLESSSEVSVWGMGGLTSNAFNSDIENCHVRGKVTSLLPYDPYYGSSSDMGTGGFTGLSMKANIKNCSAEVEVNSMGLAGGFVGGAMLGNFVNCQSYGNVKSVYNMAGGFCSATEIATFKDCVVKAESVEGYQSTGGFIGTLTGMAQNCSAEITGQVHSEHNYAGGFMGGCSTVIPTFCYAKVGKVVSDDSYSAVGGFAGYVEGGYSSNPFDSCYAIADSVISNGNKAGGFVGYNVGASAINCYAIVNDYVLGSTCAGGFYGGYEGFYAYSVGDDDESKATTTYCYSKFNRVLSNGSYAGGFIGRLEDYYEKAIDNCYAIGNSVIASDTYVGGFTGNTRETKITNCYASVDELSAGNTSKLGSFAGMITDTIVSSCFSTNNENPFIAELDLAQYINSYILENGYIAEPSDSSMDFSGWGEKPWSTTIWHLDSTEIPNLPTLRDDIYYDPGIVVVPL